MAGAAMGDVIALSGAILGTRPLQATEDIGVTVRAFGRTGFCCGQSCPQAKKLGEGSPYACSERPKWPTMDWKR